MPRIYIKETGEYANFPNGMSDQEITKAINEYLGESKKDDGIDVIDSLKAGWGAGWQDAADTGADYLDLVGADQKAEDIRGWVGEQQAEQQFAPEGFVEKLLAGVAAAPGMAAGYTPALGASAAASLALGPIAGTAAGFGAHGAVRGGDGDLMSMGALKEGAIGAVEGAAFGGIGKLAKLGAAGELAAATGKKVGQAEKLGMALNKAGRPGHAGAMAGIGTAGGAGRSLAHGEELSAEDIAAQAATMGLLGFMGGGKRTATKADAELGLLNYEKNKKAMFEEAAAKERTPGQEKRGADYPKPPEFPFNSSLFTMDQYLDTAKMVESGKISSPKKVTHETIEKMADQMIDQDRPDIARRLVLSNGAVFDQTRAGGKQAAENLMNLKVFKQSMEESRSLQEQLNAAREQNNAPEVARLDAMLAELETEIVALGGYYAGYRTEAARELSMVNSFRDGMHLSDQAALFLEKKGKLNREALSKLRSATTPEEIRAITKTAYEPTLGDKAYEAWMMGLLSNPLTWGPTGVNTVSNLAKDLLLKYPTKATQVGVEAFRAKRQGRAPEYTRKDVLDDFRVDVEQAPAVLKLFWHKAVHESEISDPGKLEIHHGAAIGGSPNSGPAAKALGYGIRTPGRWLEAMDSVFRTKAQMGEAMRIAKEKNKTDTGKRGTWDERSKLANDMLDNPRKYREEWARIRRAGDESVFTQSTRERSDYSVIAKGANVIQDLKQSPNKPVSWAAKIIAPFTRTPANIAIDALQHSPFGRREFVRLRNLVKDQENARSQEVATLLAEGDAAGAKAAAEKPTQVRQRDVSEQVAKSVVGTTMMTFAFGEALAGNVTGGGPTDYQDYQKWMAAGYQPYSFKIGDKWVSYQRIEPFASLFGMAADAAETSQAPGDEVLDRAMAAVKDNLANKTFLLGVENLSKAWANPKRYGTTFTKSVVSSVMPSIAGGMARAIDPVQRSTAGDGPLESSWNAIKNRTPLARETLEARRTVTGDVIEDKNSFINSLIPFRMKDAGGGGIVDQEISRLASLGFDVPNIQRRKRAVKGEDKPVAATTEEFAPFHEFNKKAAQSLENIMSAPSWQQLDPETQSKIIMSVYRKYGKYSSKIVRSRMYQNRN